MMRSNSRGPTLDAGPSGLADHVRRVARVVRTIIGAPDYERYVAHVRQRHPGEPVMSREEFAKGRLEARYSQPGNRCC